MRCPKPRRPPTSSRSTKRSTGSRVRSGALAVVSWSRARRTSCRCRSTTTSIRSTGRTSPWRSGGRRSGRRRSADSDRMLYSLERDGYVARTPGGRPAACPCPDHRRGPARREGEARAERRQAGGGLLLAAPAEQKQAARVLSCLAEAMDFFMAVTQAAETCRGPCPPDRAPSSSSRPASLLSPLAQTMVVPALPEIQRHYGASTASDSTWVFTVFLVTSCVCDADPRLAGRHVRQGAPAARSPGVFAAGNLVSGTAQFVEVLILGRAIQGAGGAVFPWPSASSATSSRASGWPAGSARSRPRSGSAAAWASSCPAC